MLSSATNWK